VQIKNKSLQMNNVDALLKKRVIFWDFDGVIKDSVGVKGRAFENLFSLFGDDVAKKVRAHQIANGGMSRFEKIPLYLSWAGEKPSVERIDSMCAQFSNLVVQSVIDSPWILGVRDFLLKYYQDWCFVLVTATPLDEIKFIIEELEISHCFQEVYGSPTSKSDAIAETLVRRSINPEEALMVGDTLVDMRAAEANKVPFLLKRTVHNDYIQEKFGVSYFDDLVL